MSNILILVLVAVLGAVSGYLFLRANPKKKALLDKSVEKVRGK